MSETVLQPLTAAAVRTRLRAAMPVVERWAYFDHAAVAPLPAATAAAISGYATQACQGGDVLWPQWSAGVSNCRMVAASLLESSPDEIALVNNTTQGIGLVAEGFPWHPGDNVVVPGNEFPSNWLPWRSLARRGVELRSLAVAESGEIDLDQLTRCIDQRTRMVSLSWVGFASGYRLDLARVVELVHSRGALLMVDAIQGLGAFPLSVRDLPIDFLAADGHKWMLGPEGAGILYIRRQHLNLLQPLGIGWNSVAQGSFDTQSTELKQTAGRYEGGSMNMPGLLGLNASLSLLNELQAHGTSTAPLMSCILENADRLSERLRQVGCEVLRSPQLEHQSGIVGVRWGSTLPTESSLRAARKVCLEAGVVTSVRGGRLRISTHAYNNDDDIGRLVDAIEHVRRNQ